MLAIILCECPESVLEDDTIETVRLGSRPERADLEAAFAQAADRPVGVLVEDEESFDHFVSLLDGDLASTPITLLECPETSFHLEDTDPFMQWEEAGPERPVPAVRSDDGTASCFQLTLYPDSDDPVDLRVQVDGVELFSGPAYAVTAFPKLAGTAIWLTTERTDLISKILRRPPRFAQLATGKDVWVTSNHELTPFAGSGGPRKAHRLRHDPAGITLKN